MKEIKEKEKERVKCVYVPPKVEMHTVDSCRPLASSPFVDHLQGLDGSDGFGEHMRGFLGGVASSPPEFFNFSGSHDRGVDGETGGGIHIRGNAEYW